VFLSPLPLLGGFAALATLRVFLSPLPLLEGLAALATLRVFLSPLVLLEGLAALAALLLSSPALLGSATQLGSPRRRTGEPAPLTRPQRLWLPDLCRGADGGLRLFYACCPNSRSPLPQFVRADFDGFAKMSRSRQNERPPIVGVDRMARNCGNDIRLDAGVHREFTLPSEHGAHGHRSRRLGSEH
jgi:hypothetical protein